MSGLRPQGRLRAGQVVAVVFGLAGAVSAIAPAFGLGLPFGLLRLRVDVPPADQPAFVQFAVVMALIAAAGALVALARPGVGGSLLLVSAILLGITITGLVSAALLLVGALGALSAVQTSPRVE